MGEKLLKYWQEKLHLQDWYIVLKDKQKYIDMGDNAGLVTFVESDKVALIKIVDEKDYDSTCVKPFDYEKTLVHELLHLKFCLLDNQNDDLQSRIIHQWVDDFAKLLVELKREKGE